MRKLLITGILFCLLSIFVAAETSYPNFGGLNQDFYSSDVMDFNSGNSVASKTSNKIVSDNQFMPLVTDLNGDGVNEVIVLSGSAIILYNVEATSLGGVLVYASAFNLNFSHGSEFSSNIVTYDIDSDSNPEIILYSSDTKKIYILSYDGANITDSGYDYIYEVAGANNGINIATQSMVGCGSDRGCVLVYNDRSDGNAGKLYGVLFDELSIYSEDNTTLVSSASSVCPPRYKNVVYANDYYYISYQAGTDIVLARLETNVGDHSLAIDKAFNEFDYYWSQASCSSGEQGVTEFTSPIPVSFSDSFFGDEIGIAYQTDFNNFKIIVHRSDLEVLDDFPETDFFSADGQLISNLFKANAFGTGADNSLCVTGYEPQDDGFLNNLYGKITFLCVEPGEGIQGNAQFIYEFRESPGYNITRGIGAYSVLSHSIDVSGDSRSEILNSYGTFSLDIDSCSTVFVCDSTLLWRSPLNYEGAIIPVDVLGSGKADLLALTETNLFYIDDGSINRNAYLGDRSKIQPALPNWKTHLPDEEVIYPNVLRNSTRLDTEVTLVLGTLEGNTYVQTWVKDNSEAGSLRLKEASNRISFIMNFTDVGDGVSYNQFTINYKWDKDDDDSEDVLNVYVWNWNTGNWDYKRELPTTGDMFNQLNCTSEVCTDYIQFNDSDMVSIKINDSTALDSDDDDLWIDFLAIEQYGLINSTPSNQTNEVRVLAELLDPDGDDNNSVSVTIYKDERNEQSTGYFRIPNGLPSGSLVDVTQETTTLYPNQSTTNSILEICVRDGTNYPDSPNCEEWKFTVSESGDYWYESSTEIGQNATEYEADEDDGGEGDVCDDSGDCSLNLYCNLDTNLCEELPDNERNLLTDSARDLSGIIGIPVFALIFLLIGGAIWGIFREDGISNEVKFPLAALAILFILGIATWLGLIAVIWILMFFLAIALGLSVVIARMVRG